MTERRTLTPSQQEALPSAYQRLQQTQAAVRVVSERYTAICAEIGIDPQGHYRLEGDALIVEDGWDVIEEAQTIAENI